MEDQAAQRTVEVVLGSVKAVERAVYQADQPSGHEVDVEGVNVGLAVRLASKGLETLDSRALLGIFEKHPADPDIRVVALQQCT